MSASGQEALIEGVARLEEPGRVALLCNLHDGRMLWLRGATEEEDAWLLSPALSEKMAGEGALAEEMNLGGLLYRLRLRYRAEALVLSHPPRGAVALRAGEVLVLEYRSVGGERLLGLVQGGRSKLYAGQTAPPQGLEILPSS